jgi:UDP:flavonoid glycosyltransferase YjiC (YdhE family)
MSRILIATVPVIGHIAPFLPLARALLARGHEVAWYSGHKYRARIERTGARFFGYERAPDYDDAHFDTLYPERARHQGIAQLKFDMKHIFIDAAPGQLTDLKRITQQFPADLLLADPGLIGALFLREQTGRSVGVLGVLPLMLTSDDTAPFGFGLAPGEGSLARLRNRTLHWATQKLVFGEVQRHWQAVRGRLGLPPSGWWLDSITRASFYLQPTVPRFEYPRRQLPASFHFIGMMPAEAPTDVALPAFWHELNGSRPVVHVTQGTVANVEPDLFAPALAGLAQEDVLVVLSTGNRPLDSLRLGRLPPNARVAPFLSYPQLLPRTQVMVTNGGYGGVQLALSYGVPLVVAGASEDKPEVAARVQWAGAGINLRSGKPSAESVRAAVRQILSQPTYRARARELAQDYAAHDAITRAIGVIETQLRGDAEQHGEASADAEYIGRPSLVA